MLCQYANISFRRSEKRKIKPGQLEQWLNDNVWKWFSPRWKCDVLTGFTNTESMSPCSCVTCFKKRPFKPHGVEYRVTSPLCFSIAAPFLGVLFKTAAADTVYPNAAGRVSLSGLANGLRDLSLSLETDHSELWRSVPSHCHASFVSFLCLILNWNSKCITVKILNMQSTKGGACTWVEKWHLNIKHAFLNHAIALRCFAGSELGLCFMMTQSNYLYPAQTHIWAFKKNLK